MTSCISASRSTTAKSARQRCATPQEGTANLLRMAPARIGGAIGWRARISVTVLHDDHSGFVAIEPAKERTSIRVARRPIRQTRADACSHPRTTPRGTRAMGVFRPRLATSSRRKDVSFQTHSPDALDAHPRDARRGGHCDRRHARRGSVGTMTNNAAFDLFVERAHELLQAGYETMDAKGVQCLGGA